MSKDSKGGKLLNGEKLDPVHMNNVVETVTAIVTQKKFIEATTVFIDIGEGLLLYTKHKRGTDTGIIMAQHAYDEIVDSYLDDGLQPHISHICIPMFWVGELLHKLRKAHETHT